VLLLTLTLPASAQAQASDPPPGARALLGTPAGTGRFLNLDVAAGEVMATPAERGLLGASAGLRVTLEANVDRGRRSPGESALLGR
jgi:hypothetical protein